LRNVAYVATKPTYLLYYEILFDPARHEFSLVGGYTGYIL